MDRHTTQMKDGRQAVLVRGTMTQTVNVCAADSRAGDYEVTYRLPIAEDVGLDDLAELADLAALRDWAASRNGVEVLRNGRGRPTLLPLVEVEPDLDWLSSAKTAVEVVLDDVVTEFLQHPWLHRVEHSLHAELYRRLKAQPALGGEFPLRTREMTQLVHKEWPETRPDLSPGASGRRGAFDVAVVSPDALAAATREQFHRGRIAAPIVIEVGLDYGLKHLRDDGEKMLASGVRAGYLLHLSRLREIDVSEIETYVAAPPRGLRVAYVHHSPQGGTRFKRLDQREPRSV